MVKLIKPYHGITNVQSLTKFLPTALPVGVSRLMPFVGGISPLTCTIFDPGIFHIFSASNFFYIFPTRLKYFIMGNFNFGFKIANRGNTGSYRGKKKLLCLPKKQICTI